eukprot:CAMPEP_0167747424 /NCGR_PEP_ID=MMETSP0110_2-20121227/4278_1 /TAXON_ID=629695 /ORGANISM="Gymnochlora sp., Strain CCMP2014" /LENGTH=160 /DNA_ID=CAMNT_0007632333 /DNA_START=204 /DNA_END=686 /DNA_ORIENTATION=+
MTFKVLQENKRRTSNKILWLMYWAFYGVWTLFDFITDNFFYWVPYIEVAKLVFLAWCLLPQTMGAQQIYYLIIHRVISAYEAEIDETLRLIKASISQLMTEVGQLGLEFALEFAGSMGVNVFSLLSQLLLASAQTSSSRTNNESSTPMSEIKETEEDEDI